MIIIRFSNFDGKEIEISYGYDQYIRDFEKSVLPEFKGEAESYLLETVQEFRGFDQITKLGVQVEAEKTKDKKGRLFVFGNCIPSECGPDILLEYHMYYKL